MTRKKQQEEPVLSYYVYLRDKEGAIVPVGTFKAFSPGDAIDRAIRTYPGLFNDMETRQWQAEADLRTAADLAKIFQPAN